MTRAAAIAVLLWRALPGQELIPPGSAEEAQAAESFARLARGAAQRLDCSIVSYPARLGYALRFWAGYEVTLPVPESENEGTLAVAWRITPAGGAPRYFASRLDFSGLPPGPKARRRLQLYTSGGISLGVGRYQADLLVVDSRERVCRKSWMLTAKDSAAQERIEPGVVEENRFERWPGMANKPGQGRLTVFLHAAPVFWRRNAVRLSPWDRSVLLGSLISLLDTSRFSSARVIAYNLDARKVLLESAEFTAPDYRRLLREIDSLNLGVVGAAALQQNPFQLLAELIDRESRRERSDAFVFLGPLSRYLGKPDERFREVSRQLQPAFGFVLWPQPGWTGDIVTRIAEFGGGRSLRIYSPGDLAKAIRAADGN